MKLDAGHIIIPAPWPIQSSPMSKAAIPKIRKMIAMGLFLWIDGVGGVAVLANAKVA